MWQKSEANWIILKPVCRKHFTVIPGVFKHHDTETSQKKFLKDLSKQLKTRTSHYIIHDAVGFADFHTKTVNLDITDATEEIFREHTTRNLTPVRC